MNKKIVKICLFDKNSTPSQVLGTNGDYILDNICIEAITTESLDGTYELDSTFIVDSEGLYKHIHEEAILKVQMDYGEEIFRISTIQKSSKNITTFSRQITISETLDMWIEDTRPTETSGLNALNSIKNGSIGKKDINVFSDITNISTAYYQRMNMYEAIHDCDQSFINRWGGEVQRRCYNLMINKRIGTNRGVQIRSKKNLTGFEANTNMDNVVTRIRAIGFDGIDAGIFIDSPFINKYSAIKTKEIKYENVKVKDESNPDEGFNTLQEAQSELIRLAKLEFSEKHIDELRAEYNINFIYLEDTEEYKNYTQAERVYIGDTVQVYEENHDININVRVISKKYDVLRQKVIEIELSNTDISQKTITTSDILSELNSIISKSENNNVSDIIQSMINSGIKDSYVIPRQNELIVADNKDLDKANNVIRINKNGLGFSKTGYYGDYEYGFTIDGVINASLISTGILSAILIQNADGSLQIDLGSRQGIMTRSNGKNAIELSGTRLRFYDWDGEGDSVGQLFTSRANYDENMPGLTIGHSKESYSSISYHQEGTTYKDYITFDKYKIQSTSNEPITVWTNMDLMDRVLWLSYNTSSLYNSVNDNFVAKCKNSFVVANGDNGDARLNLTKNKMVLYDNTVANSPSYFSSSPSETYFGSANYKYASFTHDYSYCSRNDGYKYSHISPTESYFVGSDNKRYFSTSPDETYFGKGDYKNASFSPTEAFFGNASGQKFASFYQGGVNLWDGSSEILYTADRTFVSNYHAYIDGDLNVTGNKNCVQSTENYGDRLYYSVEDCESYLTDRSMQLFTVKETQEGTYERVILLDNIYKESINLDLDYTVEIIKQGWGDYRIKEQTKDYFIVESDRKDFTFKYIITGKRKGFEEQRNNELIKSINSVSLLSTSNILTDNQVGDIQKEELNNAETHELFDY